MTTAIDILLYLLDQQKLTYTLQGSGINKFK